MTLATISRRLAAFTVAAAALITAQSAQAAPADHLDQLALRLQGQSRDLIREFHLHYAHTSEYRHLVSDAYSVYRLASHIHSLAHTNQSLHHVEGDLRQLDGLLHHLHDLFDHRELHPHGGHVHGQTEHVHRLLGQMEDTLHHMQSDIRQIISHEHNFGGHNFGGHGFGGHNFGSGQGIDNGHGLGNEQGRFSGGYGQFPGSSSGVTIGNGRISFRFGR